MLLRVFVLFLENLAETVVTHLVHLVLEFLLDLLDLFLGEYLGLSLGGLEFDDKIVFFLHLNIMLVCQLIDVELILFLHDLKLKAFFQEQVFEPLHILHRLIVKRLQVLVPILDLLYFLLSGD